MMMMMMMTSSRFGESVPVQSLAERFPDSPSASGRPPKVVKRRTPYVGRLSWATATSTRLRGYGNEESVGEGFRQSGLDRSDVFITTKFYPGSEDPVREIEASLERLRLEQVDLYLVHWPQGGPTWAWGGMEQTRNLGYASSIGVSNFDVTELDQVFAVATSPLVANQINLNPFSYRRELIQENRRRNLVTEAFSPLGTGRHLSNSRVQEIVERVGRSPSQVLIRWGLPHDFVVLAKSAHREPIAENAGALGFSLSEAEMAELDRLNAGSRPEAALERKWW